MRWKRESTYCTGVTERNADTLPDLATLTLTFDFSTFVENDDSDSDQSEDDSEMSESEEGSDTDAGGLDLDACPAGCDPMLYDNTCVLRDRRLDAEEQLAEERSTKDAMVRELDALQKRAKASEAATKTVEQELEAFQVGASYTLPNVALLHTLNT